MLHVQRKATVDQKAHIFFIQQYMIEKEKKMVIDQNDNCRIDWGGPVGVPPTGNAIINAAKHTYTV